MWFFFVWVGAKYCIILLNATSLHMMKKGIFVFSPTIPFNLLCFTNSCTTHTHTHTKVHLVKPSETICGKHKVQTKNLHILYFVCLSNAEANTQTQKTTTLQICIFMHMMMPHCTLAHIAHWTTQDARARVRHPFSATAAALQHGCDGVWIIAYKSRKRAHVIMMEVNIIISAARQFTPLSLSRSLTLQHFSCFLYATQVYYTLYVCMIECIAENWLVLVQQEQSGLLQFSFKLQQYAFTQQADVLCVSRPSTLSLTNMMIQRLWLCVIHFYAIHFRLRVNPKTLRTGTRQKNT